LADPRAGSVSPIAAAPDGVRVRVKVTPRARGDRVEGLAAEADGGVALKVSVTAAPEDGKANAAVVKLLSAEWGVAKSTISVVLGAVDRRKLLHVAGDPAELTRRLEDWLARTVTPAAGSGRS
jgi:uncharacterized protein (TIGR00251 family)